MIEYEYAVQGDYGHGWEDLIVESDRAEARERYGEYLENDSAALRLRLRRRKVTE